MKYTYIKCGDDSDFVFPENEKTLGQVKNLFKVKECFTFPAEKNNDPDSEAEFALMRARILIKYRRLFECVEWGNDIIKRKPVKMHVQEKTEKQIPEKIVVEKKNIVEKKNQWPPLIPGVDFDEELSPVLTARHNGKSRTESKRESARNILEGLIALQSDGLKPADAVRVVAKKYDRTFETVRCINVGDSWKDLRAEYGFGEGEHVVKRKVG